MFEYIMSADRHALLKQLAQRNEMADFYLAGGTALALYFGHRLSEDFDFFSPKEFDNLQLVSMLSEIGDFQISGQDDHTLHGLLNDVKINFLHYPYSQLNDHQNYQGILIASILDIALMKLIALVQRGTKKDFFDLYQIEKEYMPIDELLEKIPVKYELNSYDPLLIYKSMGYFDDAETEPDLVTFNELSWEQVKEHFIKRQQEFKL